MCTANKHCASACHKDPCYVKCRSINANATIHRQNSDLDNLKNLFDEATFYDRQWNATWENVKRPSENKE